MFSIKYQKCENVGIDTKFEFLGAQLDFPLVSSRVQGHAVRAKSLEDCSLWNRPSLAYVSRTHEGLDIGEFNEVFAMDVYRCCRNLGCKFSRIVRNAKEEYLSPMIVLMMYFATAPSQLMSFASRLLSTPLESESVGADLEKSSVLASSLRTI